MTEEGEAERNSLEMKRLRLEREEEIPGEEKEKESLHRSKYRKL